MPGPATKRGILIAVAVLAAVAFIPQLAKPFMEKLQESAAKA